MVKSNYEGYFSPEDQARIRNHSLDDSIIHMVQKDKKIKKILDAGAGGGVLAGKLKDLGYDVTCIELTDRYVDHLKSKGLNAKKGDVRKLDFKDNEFDLIICSEVLEHLPNLGDGLKELCRVGKNTIFTLPKMYEDEWHFWDIDYVPFVSSANCIIMKLIKKEKQNE